MFAQGIMPTRWKPNVTVAAVIERDGRFLLVEEHTANGLRLNNPAGHLEPGESLVEACMRETREETAYRFTPTALVGVYLTRVAPAAVKSDKSGATTYLRFAFCGELGTLLPDQPLDHGIVRTLWLDADEIRSSVDSHRSPALLHCVEDYLAGARCPLHVLHVDFAGEGLV